MIFPKVGSIYKGFKINNYVEGRIVPSRGDAVVEATCDQGHEVTTRLQGLLCVRCMCDALTKANSKEE